jgi:uncharacterized protein with HEPN domain
MRREELYPRDIFDAADEIFKFISNVNRESFLGNSLIRSAVLQKLTEIGEGASRISADMRSRHPNIEWRDIIAFRNIAVHAYFAVNWEIVWNAATSDAPSLKTQIQRVLAHEFPEKQNCYLPPAKMYRISHHALC